MTLKATVHFYAALVLVLPHIEKLRTRIEMLVLLAHTAGHRVTRALVLPESWKGRLTWLVAGKGDGG